MTPARLLYGLAALVLLLATTACLVHGHLALGILTESGNDGARIFATALTLALPALGLLLALVTLLRRRPLPHPASPGRALVILGALVLATRFLAMSVTLPRPVSDFAVFHELAWAVSEGHGLAYAHDTGLSEDMPAYLNRFVDGGVHPTAFRPPGAPLVYGLLYVLTGPDVGAAFLLNVLMALATTALLYLTLAPHEPGAAFWAALLWALYPTNLLANLLVGTETPFLLFLLLAAWLAGRSADPSRDGRLAPPLVLTGLALGSAALTRPTPGLLPAALLAGAVIGLTRADASGASAAPPRSRALRAAALALAGFALPFLVFGLRNAVTLGAFVLEPTSTGRNLHDFAPAYGLSPADLAADRALMRSSTDEVALAALGRRLGLARALHFLSLPPATVLTGCAVNWFVLWGTDRPLLEWVATGSPELADLLDGHDMPLGSLTPGTPSPFPEQAKLAAGLLTDGPYLALLLLSLLGSLRLALRPPAAPLPLPGLVVLILPLLALALVFTVFTGNPRFHLAVMPACALLAGSLLGDRRPPRAAATPSHTSPRTGNGVA